MQDEVKTKQEIFIKKAKAKYGDIYNYDNIVYINQNIKIEIICNKHNLKNFIRPINFLKNGCPCCIKEKRANINKPLFINKAKAKYGDKFDYSNVIYVGCYTPIILNCNIHGKIEVTPIFHLKSNHGCPVCSENNKFYYYKPLDASVFIERANSVHGDKFDYSKVIYKNTHSKVDIICNKHNILFSQTPQHHLEGFMGCPKCNYSKGEEIIKTFLENNNIQYENQRKFNNCFHKRTLPFDFYIECSNLCIEYDGSQHFIPYKHFGGIKRFDDLKIKDNIKNTYCLDNNINLLRIPYTKINNIDNILTNVLLNHDYSLCVNKNGNPLIN